jgi:hypothetical protein
MMRSTSALLALSLCAGLISGAAMAANAPVSPRPFSAGGPDIFAPYAQAEAYIGAGGAVVAAKGFVSVSHPAVGIVCLELGPGINRTRRPVVAVEWASSTGVALFAQYDSANVTCPSPTLNTIEVRTYKGDTGGVGSALQVPVLSDQVAFIITVP